MRLERALARCLMAVAICAAPLGAQGSSGAGRRVLLEIRPHVGDTIRMRLEQQVEMTGITRLGAVDSSMRFTSVMRIHSRAVVQKRESDETTLLALTDSMAVVTTDARGDTLVQAAPAGMEGTQVRLRISRDGSAEVLGDPADVRPELRSLVTQMPATLPKRPVAVGERWSKIITIPLAGHPAGRTAGTLRATFRLDSLSNGDRIAHVSVRGVLSRDGAAAAAPEIGRYEMSGSLDGRLAIDRRRGWMVDSRTTLLVRSVMTHPSGASEEPLRVQMRITQHMRTLER